MTNRARAGIVLLMCAHGIAAAGCGDRELAAPMATAPSPLPPSPVSIPPIGIGLIGGVVYDTTLRPLSGATVEVLDGPQAGTSTIADAKGEFSLSGTFDNATRFRATKEGHVAATSTIALNRRIDFYLAPVVVAAANMTGEYTLTVTADSSCDELPNEVRTRTYGATVTPNTSWHYPDNTHFDVWARGPFLVGFTSSDRIVMAMAEDHIWFWLGSLRGQPALVEQLSPTTYVAFGGGASASVDTSASSIPASLYGFIDYCVMKSATELPVEGSLYNCAPDRALTRTRCESNEHRLTLTRR
jgi:hypothetical protein